MIPNSPPHPASTTQGQALETSTGLQTLNFIITFHSTMSQVSVPIYDPRTIWCCLSTNHIKQASERQLTNILNVLFHTNFIKVL